MKHTGKITGATIVFMALMYWSVVLKGFDGRHIFFTSVFGIIVYILGERYDRNMFHANLDQLTRTFNRNYVYALFPKLLAAVKRRKTQLAVLVVDVNNLKYINDTFGHQTGDVVIQYTSATLIKQVSGSDIVARWGGDEFLIISPGMNREQANALRERLRVSFQDSTKEGNIYGASIGFSIYPEDASTLEGLIDKADQHMYVVKAANRQTSSLGASNRVIS